MKKKILAITLSTMLAFSLAACGDAEVSGSADQSSADQSSVAESTVESSEESSEEASTEEASVEESSSEENSSALADWYNSADRTALEDQINGMFADSGMNFFLEIEEPGTIIYNYQYTEPLDIGDFTSEDLTSYFSSSLDAQYTTFIQEIQNFRDAYDMPLTALRINYLDADGSSLYSQEFTEDYQPASADSEDGAADPSAAGVSGTQTYDSLEAWMDSADKDAVTSLVNSQLESSGLTMDLHAEDNVLVMEYTYAEEMDLTGYSQEEIDSIFDEQIAPTFLSTGEQMFDSFESEYGLVLTDVKVVFLNADGSQIYSRYSSDL